MKLSKHINRIFGLLACGVACAYGSTLYTFTATTNASPGSPAHLETFRLIVPDVLPLTSGGPVISFLQSDPAVITCTPCENPPVNALHFLRGGDSDLVQFADLDGTTRLYTFQLNALSNVGSYATLPGINVNRGDITVASVPEPMTTALVGAGTLALAWNLRRKRREQSMAQQGTAR